MIQLGYWILFEKTPDLVQVHHELNECSCELGMTKWTVGGLKTRIECEAQCLP